MQCNLHHTTQVHRTAELDLISALQLVFVLLGHMHLVVC